MAARIFTKLAEALAKPEIVRRIWVMTMRRSTNLPDFATFPNLEELSIDARGSGLATFPRIANCSKLTSLTFTSSNVTTVPAYIGGLAKLHTLRLVGHRKVRGLPDELCQLERLKYLAIDNNGLRHLPQAVGVRVTVRDRRRPRDRALCRRHAAAVGMRGAGRREDKFLRFAGRPEVVRARRVGRGHAARERRFPAALLACPRRR